jgi:ribosomal protein S19E (S16A)
LESVLPRMRSILRSLTIMSPACQITRARACQGGKAPRGVRVRKAANCMGAHLLV